MLRKSMQFVRLELEIHGSLQLSYPTDSVSAAAREEATGVASWLPRSITIAKVDFKRSGNIVLISLRSLLRSEDELRDLIAAVRA
jgi:hypothetical protein